MLTLKTKVFLWIIGILSFIFLAALDQSRADDTLQPASTRRLIQTSETEARWLTEEEVSSLSAEAHETRQVCGGFMDITDHPDLQENLIKGVATPVSLFNLKDPNVDSAWLLSLLPDLSSQRLQATVDHLSKNYKNRFHNSKTGKAAADWIYDEFKTMASHRNDVSINKITHKFAQPSVVARIEGSGTLANETIILGGHLDSTNKWAIFTSNAPGADDNASGIATLLEVFRVLMTSNYKPQRSLEFIGYAGEEKGMLGSLDLASQYEKEKRKIAGVLQFDMTMFPGSGNQVVFMSDYVSEPLTQYLEKLSDLYVKIPRSRSACGYACSDHSSWTRRGYPAAFPTESKFDDYNPHIHSGKDTSDRLSPDFGLHFAKLGLAFAVEATTP